MMNGGKRVGSGIGAAVVDFNKTRYYFVSFCFVVVYSFEECVAGCGKIMQCKGLEEIFGARREESGP